jgi:hypothetical protein
VTKKISAEDRRSKLVWSYFTESEAATLRLIAVDEDKTSVSDVLRRAFAFYVKTGFPALEKNLRQDMKSESPGRV